MKRKNRFKFFLALLLVGFYSCQKDNLSNLGSSTLGVKIQALNKSYSLPVGGNKSAVIGTSTLAWDTVQMVVSSIKLEAELKSLISHRDSIGIEYKWNGLQTTNLLDTTISFGNFVLQPGFYDEIEIKVNGRARDAEPMPVFYMCGTYTNGDATAISVKVEVYDDIAFKTEKDSVEVTTESIDITSYIQIYLDALLTEVQPSALDNATLVDGVILISEQNNREIYSTLMQNLEKDHHCTHYYNWEHGHDHNKHKNDGDN